jgi:hypothetical protein
MSKHLAIKHQVRTYIFALAAAATLSTGLQAAPVAVNSGFQGGVFGAFTVNYAAGDPGLQLQQVRFDLQNPLFTDPTFTPPGALLPLPFLSLTGAAETGFLGSTGIADGATSFTLFFNDFDVNETFGFELDVDTPCGSLSCQGSASLVTGSEFAGTTIKGTFGGQQFQTTELTGTFARTGATTAQSTLNGDIEPVPEPQTIGMMVAGLAAIAFRMRKGATAPIE